MTPPQLFQIAIVLAAIAALGGRGVADPAEPRPGDESGRTDEIDETPSTARLVGRSLLFVPRTALDVVATPVRGGLWLSDRYQLVDHYHRIFFTDAMTMGVIPTLQLESGFGFNAGARFVHRDLFGEHEHLSIGANTGGRYHARASASFETGDRLGDALELQIVAESDRRPKDPFYGIGNDSPDVQTRHRQQLMRVRSALDISLVSALYARVAGALSNIEYGVSDDNDGDIPIDVAYDTSMLVGWPGLSNTYGELELRWDSRAAASEWDPQAITSTGWLAAVYGGRVHQFGQLSDYWRYGADVQHFTWLGLGPRVLMMRLHGDAVGAGDVAFTELPQLGGAKLLRGYQTDRFRDRVALVGSLEYQWALLRHASASLFIDVGRVYPSLDEISLADMRLGFGMAIQFHTTKAFLAEAAIASSKDGGVFLDLTFDPVFKVSPREARR